MPSYRIPDHNNDAEISININGEVIHEIENELRSSPCDVISLGFLLIDNPNTALRSLTAYRRVSNCFEFPLYEWFQHTKMKSTWKHEFLEALLICQLYGIVRKLGFNVSSMKRYYNPDSLHYSAHINPFKKVLYKLCEDIDSENLMRLKKALRTYDITMNVADDADEAGELILLKLMCSKFITVNNYDNSGSYCEYRIEKLAKIIENLPDVKRYATELRNTQRRMCGEPSRIGDPITTSTPFASTSKVDVYTRNHDNKESHNETINEIFRMINQLCIEDLNGLNIKTDAIGPASDPKKK